MIKSAREKVADKLYIVSFLGVLLSALLIFFPNFNPARVSGLINKNVSLFTTAISWDTLTSDCGRAFQRQWVSETAFVVLMIAAIVLCIGIVATVAGACMSLGNLRLRKLGNVFSIIGALVEMLGLGGVYYSYTMMCSSANPDKVLPEFPVHFWLYCGFAVLVLVMTIIISAVLPKADKEMKYDMEVKYRLFLMFLPFAILCFLFAYMPLLGWRYAFFDYKAGDTLSMENFVGFKWFTYLFENAATRNDIVRVMRNTLVMSGLGIATSWLPMAFAIFLAEIRSSKFVRVVQTCTTIPNFISWVLVYAIALAIFSTDGFVNGFLSMITGNAHDTNYLMGDSMTWIKMLAWGTWKGLGWSAIIYIAAISGIDPGLYEAATVDGAGRFQKMWYVTMPGLLPTFCVLLLMSIAGILSNGMDQYLVFKNPQNLNTIEVLDLYVYTIGISKGLIPLSTVVGMFKTVISLVLLFAANGVSKAIRGESIM